MAREQDCIITIRRNSIGIFAERQLRPITHGNTKSRNRRALLTVTLHHPPFAASPASGKYSAFAMDQCGRGRRSDVEAVMPVYVRNHPDATEPPRTRVATDGQGRIVMPLSERLH